MQDVAERELTSGSDDGAQDDEGEGESGSAYGEDGEERKSDEGEYRQGGEGEEETEQRLLGDRVSSRCRLEMLREELLGKTCRESRLGLVVRGNLLHRGVDEAFLELNALRPQLRVGVLVVLDTGLLERLDISVRHVGVD